MVAVQKYLDGERILVSERVFCLAEKGIKEAIAAARQILIRH